MSEISKARRFEILRLLGTNTCSACAGWKQSQRSHCRRCYYALPVEMRQALYNRFGFGYEEAFETSLRYLEEQKIF